MKMCGRCENTSVPCDRDPTEHSFGNTSECSPCPDGWVSANEPSLELKDLSIVQSGILQFTISSGQWSCQRSMEVDDRSDQKSDI